MCNLLLYYVVDNLFEVECVFFSDASLFHHSLNLLLCCLCRTRNYVDQNLITDCMIAVKVVKF